MKKTKISDPDLDDFLKQTLKDDLPPEAEARMNRSFFNLRRVIDRPEGLAEPDTRSRRGESHAPERWLWVRGTFGKQILAFSSAVMLVLGGVMHLGGISKRSGTFHIAIESGRRRIRAHVSRDIHGLRRAEAGRRR